MQHLTRQFLLIFLMLWLPLVGYAATAMPFCSQDKHQGAMQHPKPALMQDDQGAHVEHQHSGNAGAACDDCSLCHMCNAMAIPLFSTLSKFKPDNLYAIPSQVSFSPFFPEQLQRPPLALSV